MLLYFPRAETPSTATPILLQSTSMANWFYLPRNDFPPCSMFYTTRCIGFLCQMALELCWLKGGGTGRGRTCHGNSDCDLVNTIGQIVVVRFPAKNSRWKTLSILTIDNYYMRSNLEMQDCQENEIVKKKKEMTVVQILEVIRGLHAFMGANKCNKQCQ